MFALFCLVARGESFTVDGVENVHYTVDWAAFREFRETEHELFGDDDPSEVVEAMKILEQAHNQMDEDLLGSLYAPTEDAEE